jgi:hypothetical protein
MENLKKHLPYIAVGAAALGTAFYIYKYSGNSLKEELPKIPKQKSIIDLKH